jgi:branched-chain amino acid transport system permease protein
MTMQKLYAILVDGTVYFSWLFIVSMGLTLIYGVMKILNIAHGSFYALGAYAAASAVGAWFAAGYPAAGSFLLLALAGIAVGGSVGLLVERGLPAQADVRTRRGRAGARHLCRLPGVRGSDQARLGR